jgi:hypothetical protein
MQIVEVSVTGVRSAVITLQRDQSPMRFILFPMIHLGTPAFYQAVTSRLRDTQLIVAEGVAGRSVVTNALTLSYRLPARRRRLNLVVQRIDYLGLGVPVIRPDITARQLRRRWRAVPALQRMAVWCLIPPFAIAVWLFGTRRVMGRYLGLDDLPASKAQPERDIAGELVELIVDHRDALLIDALVSIHEARSTEPIAVAVVYGAGHMPAVVRALLARYGYRPRAADWLTVFDF